MFDVELVKDRAHSLTLSSQEALLLCMATQGRKPLRIKDILDLALACGFSKAATWNISRELSKRKDQVVRTSEGWELTTAGVSAAEKHLGFDKTPKVLSAAVTSLRQHITRVRTEDAQAFLSEAVQCLEQGLFRAAVVLTWVGAVAVLHDRVTITALPEFNAEALKRDSKWRSAKNADGLSRMNEYDQLQVFEVIGLIGKMSSRNWRYHSSSEMAVVIQIR